MEAARLLLSGIMHCKSTFLFFTYLLLLYVWPDTRPVQGLWRIEYLNTGRASSPRM